MSAICAWYAGCLRPAAGDVAHSLIGLVPTCAECATKHDLKFVTDTPVPHDEPPATVQARTVNDHTYVIGDHVQLGRGRAVWRITKFWGAGYSYAALERVGAEHTTSSAHLARLSPSTTTHPTTEGAHP